MKLSVNREGQIQHEWSLPPFLQCSSLSFNAFPSPTQWKVPVRKKKIKETFTFHCAIVAICLPNVGYVHNNEMKTFHFDANLHTKQAVRFWTVDWIYKQARIVSWITIFCIKLKLLYLTFISFLDSFHHIDKYMRIKHV